MTSAPARVVRELLSTLDPAATTAEQLRVLASGLSVALPFPAGGHTLERWQVLSDVAAHDLSLVKLFEGHTDALAILHELRDEAPSGPDITWGVWAAESPGGRVTFTPASDGRVRLNGVKHWCSGAGAVTNALLTAWTPEGGGPYLVKVALQQAGLSISAAAWQAVGMAGSGSLDVAFTDTIGVIVGSERDYVARAGFMQGGAGIAACWFGGAVALASTLRRAVAAAPDLGRIPFRTVGLGKVDMALCQTAALLREVAGWIDRHPAADATVPALRVRQSADACARLVLDEAGRALGATPFCRDRQFARMAADLTVFTRQSLADRDFQLLGERVSATADSGWFLEA